MPDLPSGTVTFLFTDIEGSTALWEQDRQAMSAAVDRHLALLDTAIQAHRGIRFKTVGDAVQAAFATTSDAVAAALDSQRSLLAEDWGGLGPLRVRMALHAGEAVPGDRGDYLAAPLNRLSRLLSTGYGGQILLSQTVQQLTRGVLPDGVDLQDLGEHRMRDLLEPERVFQVLHPELPEQFPPLKSLDSRPNNLPRQPTPFLGREQQVGEVVALLNRADVHVLTLTGPGGTGKTRLALQAAAELLDDFADGVFLVELAPLADANLVPSAMGTALGLQEGGNQSPEETLKTYLRHKTLLLILDNFEHLLEAAPVVGGLLNTCPNVKVLATSRAPLRLRAERLYPVPPLATPDSKASQDREAIARSEAVQLFAERAQASDSSFMLTPDSVTAIADIVRRLDGLPLAIELAAARVRLLPPAALLARLEQRLPLLTGGARDAPERQRTLRATIAWSHDLLNKEEQTLFRRMGVFAGGCSLEAAEAVVNPDGDLDVLGGIASLVDHSLIRQGVGVDSTPRFTMLETINEFALEKLVASGECDELRRRHGQHFLALAESTYDEVFGGDADEWLGRLSVEQPNFRAALVWACDADAEGFARLAGALGPFWSRRSDLREASQWLGQALTVGGSPSVRFRCLLQASLLALQQSRDRRHIELAEEALALGEHHGSAKEIAFAQHNLGHALFTKGDACRAQELLTAALAWYRSAGDTFNASDTLLRLAVLATLQGNFDQGRALGAEALDMARLDGNRESIAACLFELGYMAIDEGDGDWAFELTEEAHSFWREGGNTFLAGLTTTNLGILQADHFGDDAKAEPLLAQALAFWRETGNLESAAVLLNRLGHLARRRGDIDLAEARHQEALALSKTLDDAIPRAIGTVSALTGLGQVACTRGGIARALGFCRVGLERLAEVDPREWHRQGSLAPALKVTGAECLRLTACAAGEHNAERATRVLGAAAACRTASLRRMLRAEQARALQDEAFIRGLLTEAAFTEAWKAGEALSFQDAIDEGLKLTNDFAVQGD